MCVTEAWPPNAQRARELLAPRGVEIHIPSGDGSLPFPDRSFELVTARHPVRPPWTEIHRVLVPGGHYFAQHAGPASAFELIEFLLGPRPNDRLARNPDREAATAESRLPHPIRGTVRGALNAAPHRGRTLSVRACRGPGVRRPATRVMTPRSGHGSCGQANVPVLAG
jgi:hypothetical protein